MKPHRLICIGKITSAHGVRGEMKLLPYLEDTSYLSLKQTFFDKSGQQLTLKSLRSGPKKFFLITLEGVHSPEDADSWKEKEVFMKRSCLPNDLEDEMYYSDDLVGLKVSGHQKNKLMHVVAVHNFGAGDILEIEEQETRKTYFVPFRKEAVPLVCPKEGLLEVTDSFLLEDEKNQEDKNQC